MFSFCERVLINYKHWTARCSITQYTQYIPVLTSPPWPQSSGTVNHPIVSQKRQKITFTNNRSHNIYTITPCHQCARIMVFSRTVIVLLRLWPCNWTFCSFLGKLCTASESRQKRTRRRRVYQTGQLCGRVYLFAVESFKIQHRIPSCFCWFPGSCYGCCCRDGTEKGTENKVSLRI